MSKQQENNEIRNVVEAALLASEVPLSVRKIQNLFDDDAKPEGKEIQKALKQIESECEGRGIELCKIGKGYRFQTRERYAQWMRRLRDTRPPRYSRAMLETLAIIAYRQPVTRGDIESIRGVAVSSDIMRVLLDREWITQVGHRDVPGRPSLYATSAAFLEYFNLRSLSDLPSLIEPRDINEVAKELNITLPVESSDDGGPNKADVLGVDAEGNPIVNEDDDDAEEDFDERLDARREQAEAEITESLETIDAELAAIPKITRKAIDSLRADTPVEGDEAKADAGGDSASAEGEPATAPVAADDDAVHDPESDDVPAQQADAAADVSDAASDVEARVAADDDVTAPDPKPDADASPAEQANGSADETEAASDVETRVDAAVETAVESDVESAIETVADESVVPAESDAGYEPLASDADVARALSATSFAFGADSDFDDNLDDIAALNPVVHTVGEAAASDIDGEDATEPSSEQAAPEAPVESAGHDDGQSDLEDDIDPNAPRQADRDH